MRIVWPTIQYFHVGAKFYKSLHWQKSTATLASLDCISHMHDWELYRALSANDGPLPEGNAISLNTDGVECFHSTNQSFWSALLMISFQR